MSKRLSGVILAFALLPLALLAADAPDISGTWTASIDTQIGKQDYVYTFVAKGSKLTGRAKSANGDTEITEGTVDGNKVSFVENLDYQGMPLRIAYSGNLTSSGAIDFTRDVAGQAMEKFTAKRAK